MFSRGPRNSSVLIALSSKALLVLLAHICYQRAVVAKEAKVNENAANVALLRPSEQSSTFASKIAALAVDGNPETCSVTEGAKNDNQRWWSVKLPSGGVNVREVAVTINHGVAFHQQFTVFIIARSGDLRTKFVKCDKFDGLFRAGMRHVLKCPNGGITGEKVYIRDDRREGSLSLCEVEVVAHSTGICSEPPAIANGTVSVLGGTQQQLRYNCEPGYLLLGSSDLYCRPDNTWSSPPPTCGQMTCGYPHVEDSNAVVASSHYTIEKSMGATMGDEATIVCNEGFQMVANRTTEMVGLRAVQDVRVICGRDGVWERPFQYQCIDRDILAQMVPSMTSSISSTTDSSNATFTTQSLVYTLLAIVFFILLLLVLTLLLRRKRVKSLRRRAEANVTMPRMHSEQGINLKSSRPLISIFTTLDNKSGSSASTTNLMQSQHNSSSNAKLLSAIDDDSLSRSQPHQALFKPNKKISYEEDLQLPESGSLVQGVSVDPHSAVFGRNGVRLEELERQFQNGLPDVTVANFYQRPTPYLSSFQPPTVSNPWHNSNLMGSVPPPPQPVRPLNGGGLDSPPKQSQTIPSSSLPSSSHLNGIPRLFSVRSLNESVIMAPPNFNTEVTTELPELDEAGYASLIMRSNKSMEVHPTSDGVGQTPTEPLYERIKGERAGPQEAMVAHDNFSDSSESHAYYSKVPKEDCSLEPLRPPPLKEHLYQNFDQVFKALEAQQRSQPFQGHQHHPDLLHNSSGINDGFYENTRLRPLQPSHEEAEAANSVVVSDEKLRTMYAQVDVAKKHSERSHKAAAHQQHILRSHAPLQVVDQVAQDIHEIGSLSGASLPKSSPFSDVDLGSVHTAWEEHI